MSNPAPPERRELLTEKVLRAVELIPSGTVASYGDIAAVVGTGARQVGAVMAREGAGVPWWRVTNAAGRLPEHLIAEATRQWNDEAITLTRAGTGCRITAHRTDLAALARAYDDAIRDLP